MLEIRWHGRGGQGAKTVSQVLAEAALHTGFWIQAFPEYGPERSGAPVKAYNRLDEKEIVTHEGVYEPDVVVVIDPTLLDSPLVDVVEGLKPQGALVVNSTQGPGAVREKTGYEGTVLTVDAEAITRQVGIKHANVVLLGALLRALDGLIALADVEAALRAQLEEKRLAPETIQANLKALAAGYEQAHLDAPRSPTPTAEGSTRRPRARARANTDTGPLTGKLPIGGVITGGATSLSQVTGDWRPGEKPVFDVTLCVNCLSCWVYCPDDAILTETVTVVEPDPFTGKGEKRKVVQMAGYDYDHCKGCRLCEAVCPTGAIAMVPEAQAVPEHGRMEGADKEEEEVIAHGG